MELQRIIIGMDFSDAAIDAAAWAKTLAPDADVTLVHAIEPADRPRFLDRRLPPPEEVEGAAREFATRRLDELVKTFGASAARTLVRVGKASEVVCEVARDERADLVIIGPHGARPRPTSFFGTTADRIVRLAPCSVLVATHAASPPRRLLVPVDDAEITPTLLEWASDLANVSNSDITLLHVWSNAVYSHVASMAHATSTNAAEARDDIQAEIAAEANRWLDQLVGPGTHRDRVNALVKHGRVGDVVIEVAQSIAADLIVLGRQGSGLIAPALLGSTVGAVLRNAPCSVLVVAKSPA